MRQFPLRRKHFAAALLGLSLLALAALASGALPRLRRSAAPRPNLNARLDSLPPVILWAWERPEQLDFLDPREAGVAYLARTIYLRDAEVAVRPRLQPLKVSPETALVAVVRVESDKRARPRLSAQQRERTAEAVAELLDRPNLRALQIDFDAALSERDFYRELLFDLRRRLPDSMPLIITALASWCLQDDWLAGLPVDEAVPMLFRMGADEHQVRLHLKSGGAFGPTVCRSSLGVSTDEPFAFKLPDASRVYVFHPRPWSATEVRASIQSLKP